MILSVISRSVAGVAGALILTVALGACVSSTKSMSASKQDSMSTSMDASSKKSSDSSMMTAKPKNGSTTTMSGSTTMQ